jgi:hypothetical protein
MGSIGRNKLSLLIRPIITYASLVLSTQLAADEVPELQWPGYSTEFVEPCAGKGIGASCSIFFENEWQQRRCVEGRNSVLICAGGDPKELDSKIFEACEGKTEKDACVAPLKDRDTGRYMKIPGHCNNYRNDRLVCLPGDWPWRD